MLTPVTITTLTADSFKRLSAVRIGLDGRPVVAVEGRNGQGKSSVLDAIAAALGGNRSAPMEPVKRGAKRAAVVLTLSNGLRVERSFTSAGGSSLKVTSEGAEQKSPQAILDRLVGDLTFDPLGFTRLKPADQAEVLRKLAGLDFTAIEKQRAALFTERTVANREAATAKAQVPPPRAWPKDLPAEPVSVTTLIEEHRAAERHNAAIDQAEKRITELEAGIREAEEEIRNWQRAIEMRTKELTETKQQIGTVSRQNTIATAEKINKVEETNNLIRARAAEKASRARAEEAQTRADALTTQIEKIDADKAQMLAAANFPLDGLSIDERGVLLNGLPFSQASSSEQLRASVAIGLSQNPELRVMLVRDGSLLDSAAMTDLASIASEHGAQVWVERVADRGSPSAIVIEDGEVVEVEDTVAAQ